MFSQHVPNIKRRIQKPCTESSHESHGVLNHLNRIPSDTHTRGPLRREGSGHGRCFDFRVLGVRRTDKFATDKFAVGSDRIKAEVQLSLLHILKMVKNG